MDHLSFDDVRLTCSNFRSETRHKTLEEIAAAFGDKVVEVGERDLRAERSVFEEKAGVSHFESSEKV